METVTGPEPSNMISIRAKIGSTNLADYKAALYGPPDVGDIFRVRAQGWIKPGPWFTVRAVKVIAVHGQAIYLLEVAGG